MPEMTEEQRKELEERIKKMSPEELKEFQKQQCIFCQIIGGKVPSKKVYEDEKCLAVMDINPAAIGHVLLMPKEHYAIMPQIPDEEIGHMFMVSKHLSQAMLRKLKVEGTNIFVANGMVAGQKAQHFMIHIIPRKEGDGVLEVPEHLVEEGVREKAGEVIGKRVNELLGIKKEKVKIEEEEVGKEIPPTTPSPKIPEEKPSAAPTARPEEAGEKIVEAEFEEEKEEEAEEEKPAKKGKKKGRKKKKKKAGEEGEEEEKGGEEGADLDDIAKLFK